MYRGPLPTSKLKEAIIAWENEVPPPPVPMSVFFHRYKSCGSPLECTKPADHRLNEEEKRLLDEQKHQERMAAQCQKRNPLK